MTGLRELVRYMDTWMNKNIMAAAKSVLLVKDPICIDLFLSLWKEKEKENVNKQVFVYYL